ncbi:MAG: hypothetical protein NC931_05530, partial [Candidatus Omnitrophica bacterium]|nr:hypothetical protein [Candidatus Omnitrophota bacterium]
IPARIRMTHVQPCIAVAGEKITLRLKFPIPKEIRQDEMIKLQIYGGRNNKGIFPDLHTTNPRKDGYVFAETSSRLFVKIQGSGKNYGTFIITPGAGGIKAGEHIFITLKNAKCPDKRFLNKFFVLYKDDLSPAEGSHKAENVWNKETQKKIIAAALMHIIGGDIHSIKAYAPSNVVAGKKFSLLIRPIDRFANLSLQYLKNRNARVFSELM